MQNTSFIQSKMYTTFGFILLFGALVPFHQATALSSPIMTSSPNVNGIVTRDQNAACDETYAPVTITIRNTIPAGSTLQIRSDTNTCTINSCGRLGWTLIKTYVQDQMDDTVIWNHASQRTCPTPGTHTFGLFDGNVDLLAVSYTTFTPIVAPPVDTIGPSCSRISFSQSSPQTKGSQITISPYASDNVGISRIELYNNPPKDIGVYGGNTWQPLGSVSFSGGSIIWNTSDFSPKTYTIGMKVYDTSNNVDDFSINGMCKATYTITEIPSAITVLSPNGGEILQANSPTTISWTGTSFDHYALYYSLDSGRNWTFISRSVYGTSYVWVTPVISPDLQINTVKIRVVGENNQNQSQLQDESNADFTLRNAQTSPMVVVSHNPINPGASTQVIINASATDSDGIRTVKIYIDGTEVRTCYQQPYCFTPGNTYSVGTHTYYATAEDTAGTVGSSPTQTFTIGQQQSQTIPQVLTSHTPSAPTTNDYVYVTANASDPDGIRTIRIYVDGIVRNTCANTTSCTFSLQYSIGSHSYYAQAEDYQNQTGTSSTQSFTVNQQNISPPLTIPTVSASHFPSSPTTNELLAITANASDPDAIQNISIYINGIIKNTCTSTPVCQTQGQQYPIGTYSYYATATDFRGTVGNSASQSFVVSGTLQPPPGPNTIPLVSVSHFPGSPSNNDLVTLTATAQDADGIQGISIYIDGSIHHTCSQTTSCPTPGRQFNPGTHTYYATAIDSKGSTGISSTQNFTVSGTSQPPPTPNTTPIVSVSHSPSSPIPNDFISIQASASDPDAIRTIRIYIDGTLRNTCQNTISCTTSATQYGPGVHSYYAQAEDYQNQTGTSNTQSFTVQNNTSGTIAAEFSAYPSSGTAPLLGVSLTAIVSGTAQGVITYRFDCTGDGIWEQTITSFSSAYTATGLCRYSNSGIYTARISAERSGMTSQGTVGISVR